MLQSLHQLFFPRLCYGCQSILLEQEDILCLFCFSNLDYLDVAEKKLPIAEHRFYGKLSLQQLQVMFYYHKEEGIIHSLIEHLKYKKREEIGSFLAQMVIERFQNHPVFNVDEMVAVPLHPKKQKIRGYNQLHLFCKTLSEHYNIPFNKNRIFKNVHEESQTKKNLLLRSTTKKERFTVNFDESDHKKHFLLIDDIITSGSTMEQIGKKLLHIPDAKLSAFAIAITQ